MNSVSHSAMTFAVVPVTALSSIFWVETSFAQVNFSDVGTNYWAKPYIETLAQKDIIKGFPDGTFRPNEPVTRAQFAALIRNAFDQSARRTSRTFADVKSSYWASSAIDRAYTTGFLSGYPNGTFAPEQKIPKVQALVSLASGLKLSPVGSIDATLNKYSDQAQIPSYARPGVAAATQRSIPVNYPQVSRLMPAQQATRADIAAYLYQALVSQGTLSPIASSSPAAKYIVQGGGVTTAPSQSLAAGTEIPVVIPGGNPEANLVMAAGESFETSFEVAADVVNAQKEVMIPQGSTVAGIFEPETVNGRSGVRFKAQTVTVANNTFELQATSAPFLAQRKNQLTVNDVAGGISTIAAASALDSLFNRIGGAAGVDGRVIGAAKRGLNVGSLLPTVIQTGQTLTQKATSQDDVILVEPMELGLTLDSNFRFAPAASPQASAPKTGLIVATGSQLDLGTQSAGTKYVALPGETFPIKLQVSKTLYSSDNKVLIPEGSVIQGSLKPGSTGAVFSAEALVINGRTYPLDAMTALIPTTDIQDLSLADFRGNVVASPKASSVLTKIKSGGSTGASGGGILGQILGGGSSQPQVIIFDPTTTPLELGSELVLQADS